MSVLIQGNQVRSVDLGFRVQKAYSPLVVETKTLFNVVGGKVLITSIVGQVTTDITVANTVKLQANPTVGTTGNLVAATDLGTTDTLTGSLLGFDGAAASTIQQGVGTVPLLARPIAVNTGTIEQVTATGADGGITWVLTYVPIDDGAYISAA